MSDSGIEKLYEEQLQAEPKLLLYVDGSLKRVEPNTPEGRQAINKAALRYSETSDNVQVGRAGAGAVPSGAVARPQPSARLDAPEQPASPRSTCCEPRTFPGPSGIRKRHSFLCPVAPGRPFSRVTVHDISDVRLSRRHAIETRRTGLDDAIRAHPSSYLSPQAHDRWHPGQGEDCIECAERGHPG